MRLVALFPFIALSASAFAADGASVLTAMDAKMNAYADQKIVFEVANLKPGQKDTQSMGFTTHVKDGKTLTEFTAPGDIKGTKVLVLSHAQMYVWLPDYGKVRRVASHATEQGFMGTTLSQSDMATLAFSPLYDANLDAETDAAWDLTLTAKADAEVSYRTLKMTVDKKLSLPTKIAYVNGEGVVVKTEARSNYICEGAACTPGTLRMTDHSRNDAWTELTAVEVKFDSGLEDGLFTVRSLQTGG